MDEKKIDFNELCQIATEWMIDPENKEIASKFNDIQQQIVIRPFIPINKKEILVRHILADSILLEESFEYDYFVSYEISLTLKGLLAYTNIDFKNSIMQNPSEYYDCIWQSGIGDMIENVCERDYRRLTDMVKEQIEFYNVDKLIDLLQNINGEDISKLVDEIQNFENDIDPDLFKNMAEIVGSNDPIVGNVRQNIEELALKAINERE